MPARSTPRTPSPTRRQLLDAAEELFATRGIDAVSLAEITQVAGLRNTGAVHHHFGGREELLAAVVDEHRQRLDARRSALLDEPAVQQPQRELRLSPDGITVGFSQVRTAADGSTAFVAAVGRLRRTADRYVIDDARAVSRLGELKNFTPDGRAVLIAGFTTLPDRAADPDIVQIDLTTSEQTDVTDNGDYDEDISFAPDGRSYAVFSGRGTGLFETMQGL